MDWKAIADDKKEKVFICFRESLWQSICSDVLTFGMLTFCIWFSGDSKFWQFICFVMLIMFVYNKAAGRVKMFYTKQDIKDWIERQK